MVMLSLNEFPPMCRVGNIFHMNYNIPNRFQKTHPLMYKKSVPYNFLICIDFEFGMYQIFIVEVWVCTNSTDNIPTILINTHFLLVHHKGYLGKSTPRYTDIITHAALFWGGAAYVDGSLQSCISVPSSRICWKILSVENVQTCHLNNAK